MKLNLPFLTHLVFFFFFIHLPTSLCANDNNCSLSFNCGDIVGITYPFWGNFRPDYCGHPKFQLTCQNNFTQIKIMSETYRVLSIDQTAKTMRIVRIDFLYGFCPLKFDNDSLDFTHFDYTANDGNLTLFYHCTSAINNFRYRCQENKMGAVYAFIGSDPMSLPQNLPCEKSIVSVLRSAVDDNSSTLNTVLKEGFDIEYVVDDAICKRCVDSGGGCGYNSTSLKPICFCSGPKSCTTTYAILPPPNSINNRSEDVQKKASKGSSKHVTVAVATIVGVLFFIATIVVIFCCLRRECSLVKLVFGKKTGLEDLGPKSYKYSEIKKMTNNFTEKLGEGGYGDVYKGKINDDTVAVKVLKEMKGGFKNEIDTIRRTSHVNIVTLRGYCIGKEKSALIYEYMPNGSLEKFIFGEESLQERSQLGWEKLYDIAVGIARGLEYLHNGCNSQILHFDIKPHNILLDQDFHPKISDFGHSKLCREKKNTVSVEHARGTPGYIAPELRDPKYGKVTRKLDVYSYGMMVLEMVGGTKNLYLEANASDTYISTWIQKRVVQSGNQRLLQVMTEEDTEIVIKMSVVGFRCIEEDPSNRPEMRKVLEMLEGNLATLQTPILKMLESNLAAVQTPPMPPK